MSTRLPRRTYWIRWVLALIAYPIVFTFARAIGQFGLFFIYLFVALTVMIVSTSRRIQDVGLSPWFTVIPIVNLILAACAGTRGPNRFGPDPLAPRALASDTAKTFE